MNFTRDIILENSRVRLEPLRMDYLNQLLPVALKTPDLLKYSPSPFGSEERLKSNIQTSISARESGTRYPFVIFDKQKSAFVGSTSFGHYSAKDLRVEIGWTWIDTGSQRTGLNANCKYLLLSFAFETNAMERVEFRTDSRNTQSRKAIEKIGGVYEGLFRSHTRMEDGYRRDTVYYSIIKSEWPKAKSLIEKSL